MKELVAKGVDINGPSKWGETALFKAVDRGHVEIVKALVQAGAKLDFQRNDLSSPTQNPFLLLQTFGWRVWPGDTALMYAAMNGHVEIAKILVQAGAKLDIQKFGVRRWRRVEMPDTYQPTSPTNTHAHTP